jgi:hypothetical protein
VKRYFIWTVTRLTGGFAARANGFRLDALKLLLDSLGKIQQLPSQHAHERLSYSAARSNDHAEEA